MKRCVREDIARDEARDEAQAQCTASKQASKFILTHDIKDKRKGRRRIQSIGLCRIGTSPRLGQANGLPSVVTIAHHHGQAHARYNLAPNNVVDIFKGSVGKIDQVLNGKEGTEQGGQVVKKELRQGTVIPSRHGVTLLEILQLLDKAAGRQGIRSSSSSVSCPIALVGIFGRIRRHGVCSLLLLLAQMCGKNKSNKR